MRFRRRVLCAMILSGSVMQGAIARPDGDVAKRPAADPLHRGVAMLRELAGIPSESSNRQGVSAAAAWLEARFGALGFQVRRLQDETGSPFVLADRPARAGAPSVLFYLHYDTQPPGPASDWPSTGGHPFQPTLLSGRFE